MGSGGVCGVGSIGEGWGCGVGGGYGVGGVSVFLWGSMALCESLWGLYGVSVGPYGSLCFSVGSL